MAVSICWHCFYCIFIVEEPVLLDFKVKYEVALVVVFSIDLLCELFKKNLH